jgi:cellulose synthase/poly-beta-1,6-N-acetylglucosamine synthase-like glycosyltransferase
MINYNKVSVIVTASGSAPQLEKCLESILNLAYQNFELYLVDDGLVQEAKNISAYYSKKIKILVSGGKGPSFARNLAARSSDAEFIAFTDSDCLVDKDWIKELLEGFKKNPQAASCGGIQKLPTDATSFERKVFFFMSKAGLLADYMRNIKTQRLIEVNHNPSCNVMYRRDIFLKEGGFLEGLWPGEDVELDYRLRQKGHILFYNPKAIVFHYRPKDLRAFLKVIFRYGFSCGFLTRKYGFFMKIQLVPPLAIFYIFGALFLSFALGNFIFLLGLFCFLIVPFCLYFKLQTLPLALLAIAYWNAGYIKGLLRKYIK